MVKIIKNSYEKLLALKADNDIIAELILLFR